jgi:hypothetical protein
MKKIVSLLLVLISSITLLAQVPKDWKSYKDDFYHYKVSYPGKWELDSKREGARFFLFTPLESNDDLFRENFNLQAQDMSGYKMKFKEYVDLNLQEITTSIGDYKKISARYFTWNGKQAYEVVYSGTIKSVPYPLKWTQRYMLHNNMSYVLTYSSVAGKQDIYRSTALKVMDAFVVL